MAELKNLRPTRFSRDDFAEAAGTVWRLASEKNLRGGQANIAFFFVSPGKMRLAAFRQAMKAARDWAMVLPEDEQSAESCTILCRNEGRGGNHSERCCGDVFDRWFSKATIDYVFSEREPCHDKGVNCSDYLANLLSVSGAKGESTPVRYYAHWASREELATASSLDRDVNRGAEARAEVNLMRKQGKEEEKSNSK